MQYENIFHLLIILPAWLILVILSFESIFKKKKVPLVFLSYKLNKISNSKYLYYGTQNNKKVQNNYLIIYFFFFAFAFAENVAFLFYVFNCIESTRVCNDIFSLLFLFFKLYRIIRETKKMLLLGFNI